MNERRQKQYDEYYAWGKPNYYVLINHCMIDTTLFVGLPTSSIGNAIYIVEFQAGGIENPTFEPIGVYHYSGIRRFMWRDKFFSEYPLDHRSIIKQISLRPVKTVEELKENEKVLEMLRRYGTAPAPNFNSATDSVLLNPEKSVQRFFRAIYLING